MSALDRLTPIRPRVFPLTIRQGVYAAMTAANHDILSQSNLLYCCIVSKPPTLSGGGRKP